MSTVNNLSPLALHTDGDYSEPSGAVMVHLGTEVHYFREVTKENGGAAV